MVVGKKDQFAIEYEIKDTVDKWILGRFRLWIKGESLGDWEDDSVDLKGCFNWLPTLIDKKVTSIEAGAEGLSGEQVMSKIFDSFYSEKVVVTIKDSFFRFHINHIGMSSFDHFDAILLEEAKDYRFVWRNKSKKIFDKRVSKKDVVEILESAHLDYS